jgi:hypothetical protein
LKKLMMAALVTGQVLAAAQPAAAADFAAQEQRQMGGFAGARLRIPLGGERANRKMRAGLTLAPMMNIRDSSGDSRTRLGEGLELGVGQNRPLELSLAGTRIDRLGMAPRGTAPGGRRAGVSTLGWIAIGVGTAIVVTAAAGYLWLEDALDCDDPGDDCS